MELNNPDTSLPQVNQGDDKKKMTDPFQDEKKTAMFVGTTGISFNYDPSKKNILMDVLLKYGKQQPHVMYAWTAKLTTRTTQSPHWSKCTTVHQHGPTVH